MVACLESGNYIQIRNALIVLTKVRGMKVQVLLKELNKYIEEYVCIWKCFSWSLNVTMYDHFMNRSCPTIPRFSSLDKRWREEWTDSDRTRKGNDLISTPWPWCKSINCLYLHVLVPRPRCKSNDWLYLHVLVPRPWCLIRNLHNHVHVGNNTYNFC